MVDIRIVLQSNFFEICLFFDEIQEKTRKFQSLSFLKNSIFLLNITY